MTSGGSEEFSSAPIIVISIDTLRADRLPAYGYSSIETPAINALRADSILFENAYSHSPLTLPSHISMFTGKLPAAHGVRNNLGYSFDAGAHPTIPSRLRAAGYATGAAVSSYVLRGTTGLGEAFDHYDDAIPVVSGSASGRMQRSGNETVAASMQWIERQGSAPFFMFLHLFEPHSPYEAPEPFRSRHASAYDAEIAYVDSIVGAFLDQLRQRGIYDRATIILMSDHGEGLMDHGEAEHGIFLYREAIRIPLMLKLPGSGYGGSMRSDLVQLIDVLPTIEQIAALPREASSGRSLLAPSSDEREIFSETMYPRIHLGWSELRSIIGRQYHYIHGPSPELFDVISDPAERDSILSDRRRVAASMRSSIARYAVPFSAHSGITPEDAASLKALGYLGSAAPDTDGPLPDPKSQIADLEILASAAALSQDTRFDSAIELLTGVVTRNPAFTDAWSQLAATYDAAGRIDRAVEVRKSMISRVPALASELALSLAGNFLALGQFEEAESHASIALESNPPAARLLLGRVHLGRKNFVAAEREARFVLGDGSYRFPAAVLLAQARAAQGRENFADAMGGLDSASSEIEARKLDPVPLLEYARGDILARMNRPEEAEAAFTREIQAFPGNRQAYEALAVVQLLQGRPADAVATLRRLVERNRDASATRLAISTLERFGERELADSFRSR